MNAAILISNNPRISELKSAKLQMNIYQDKTALQILSLVRDFVHKNHRLLTHPLHSSLKPNETPFRTVLISATPELSLHLESLQMIENAIHYYQNFLKDKPYKTRSAEILADFSLIDFDLIKKAIT
ncbi:MAG: GrdX family protein [Candidatus Cloacimonadales bacterium]